MRGIRRHRVVATGAGQGQGREHALALAVQGARSVVNNQGDVAKTAIDGIGTPDDTTGADLRVGIRRHRIIATGAGRHLGHRHALTLTAQATHVVADNPRDAPKPMPTEIKPPSGTPVTDPRTATEGTDT